MEKSGAGFFIARAKTWEGFRVTRLKLERLTKGISQTEVGSAARIAQPAVSAIERGRLQPTPAQLARLADIFKVAPSDLLRDVVVLGSSR